ncbi:hypothetical protein [Xanthocytophaga flava]|uniref:hypothetical protein n=1 Tax=Xanthocytophaga flava TaxID=3048013 RepID=UPI0028D23111|nr:hypothetical protein [Xanthocytophaga flavus]MDJ1466897.1 hypothetical protein [Xanthocytophaga flavus]
MKDVYMKYQACLLCDALHRNINDNFLSVSFELTENQDIRIRIILKNKTEVEEEYIGDLLGEFEAQQGENNIADIEVYVNEIIDPLQHIVFQC